VSIRGGKGQEQPDLCLFLIAAVEVVSKPEVIFFFSSPAVHGWDAATMHPSPIYQASFSLELKHYTKPDESGLQSGLSDTQP